MFPVRRLSQEIAMPAPLEYSGEMGIIDNPLINLLRLLDQWWGSRERREKVGRHGLSASRTTV